MDGQPYFVYSQLGKNYLNAYRKLYWYANRNPTLTPRKQRMGNILYAHGYRNSPREIVAAHGSQLRYFLNNQSIFLIKSIANYMSIAISLISLTLFSHLLYFYLIEINFL